MVRYRSRFDIIADVMRVAGKGANKTRIMYLANLSYLLLEKYLWETIRAGFLQLGDGGYSVTEKGEEFLIRYSRFLEESSHVERDIESLRRKQVKLERMCKGKGADCRRGLKLRNGGRRRVSGAHKRTFR